MDNQEEFFDLTKLISRSWASLITQDKVSLSALMLMIGFAYAEQSEDKKVSEYLMPHLKRTVEKIEESIGEKKETEKCCSFCARTNVPLVAGYSGFICMICAEQAIKELAL